MILERIQRKLFCGLLWSDLWQSTKVIYGVVAVQLFGLIVLAWIWVSR